MARPNAAVVFPFPSPVYTCINPSSDIVPSTVFSSDGGKIYLLISFIYAFAHPIGVMEIEVKAPIDDGDAVIRKAIALGAKIVNERDQEDLYFAHPVRDFGQTDEALRLRKDGAKQVMTYKGPKIDKRSKTREEIEFVVPYSDMRTVLARLGFKESFKVRKHRVELELEGVSLCIDEVEGLGSFAELEYEGQDVETGLKKIESLKKRLSIEGNETRSYLELLYYKQ